ncbi:MAG: hypothetical protein MZU97_01220 [Bacillus subtilis]|nr:hypothetical protein [Bacillus subtilis]
MEIRNSHGVETFTLRLTDAPIAEQNQNVTKFTYESILAERLRVAAVSPWTIASVRLTSVQYYSFVEGPTGPAEEGILAVDQRSASGDFGSLTLDDVTKRFDVSRTNGWFGVIVFTYIATDTCGVDSAPITMDVVFKQMTPQIADKDLKTYVYGSGIQSSYDIVYSITNAVGTSDFPVHSLWLGSSELTLNVDYSIGVKVGNTRYFTITSGFLSSLSPGIHTITLRTHGGMQDFVLTVLQRLSTSEAILPFQSRRSSRCDDDARRFSVDGVHCCDQRCCPRFCAYHFRKRSPYHRQSRVPWVGVWKSQHHPQQLAT